MRCFLLPLLIHSFTPLLHQLRELRPSDPGRISVDGGQGELSVDENRAIAKMGTVSVRSAISTPIKLASL